MEGGERGDEVTLISMDTINTQNKTKTKNVVKKETSSSSSEDLPLKSRPKVELVPLHLVVKSRIRNRPFTSLSYTLIEGSIKAVVGVVKNVKKLSNGLVYVHCISSVQASKLLKVKELSNIPVCVEVYICKGVISCYELLNASEEEIREYMADQNVVDVSRITRLEDGEVNPTYALILSFALPKLPEQVMAIYCTSKVTPYAPNPIRCYKCQRFGHIQSKCKKKQVCPECGKPGHRSTCKKKKVSCVNCKGQHSAWSCDCPAWKEHQEIEKLVTISKMSRKEAREEVRAGGAATPAERKSESEPRRTNNQVQDSVHGQESVVQQQRQELRELSEKLGRAMELLSLR